MTLSTSGYFTFPDLYQLALNAGFTGGSAQTAAAIALAESGGNPNAVNPNDPGGSFGLMQINEAAHPGLGQPALDPQTAFDTAYAISEGGTNFSPWTTFTSSAYKKFLAAAQTAQASVAQDFGGGGYGTAPGAGEAGANVVTGPGTGLTGGSNIPAGSTPNWLGDLIGTLYGWFQRSAIIVAALVLMAFGLYAMLHATTVIEAARKTTRTVI